MGHHGIPHGTPHPSILISHLQSILSLVYNYCKSNIAYIAFALLLILHMKYMILILYQILFSCSNDVRHHYITCRFGSRSKITTRQRTTASSLNIPGRRRIIKLLTRGNVNSSSTRIIMQISQDYKPYQKTHNSALLYKNVMM